MDIYPASQLLERTAASFATMGSLDRYHGHFFNWYDTLTLKPLFPLYVSTVDSGNLVAHVLTLEPGIAALADQPVLAPCFFAGLINTLGVFIDHESQAGLKDNERSKAALVRATNLLQELEALRTAPPADLRATCTALEQLTARASEIREGVTGLAESQAVRWADALVQHCHTALDDLIFMVPWSRIADVPNELNASPWNALPTLRELASLDPECFSCWNRLESLRAGGCKSSPLVREAIDRARARIGEIERLTLLCSDFARLEYGFLYDEGRQLMSIGYNVSNQQRRDENYVRIPPASEARLASFVAIAQGQVPQDNWFRWAASSPTLQPDQRCCHGTAQCLST